MNINFQTVNGVGENKSLIFVIKSIASRNAQLCLKENP